MCQFPVIIHQLACFATEVAGPLQYLTLLMFRNLTPTVTYHILSISQFPSVLGGWCLSEEDPESLFGEDSVLGELVVGTESGRVGRERGLAGGGYLLEGVDSLALVVYEVLQIHA